MPHYSLFLSLTHTLITLHTLHTHIFPLCNVVWLSLIHFLSVQWNSILSWYDYIWLKNKMIIKYKSYQYIKVNKIKLFCDISSLTSSPSPIWCTENNIYSSGFVPLEGSTCLCSCREWDVVGLSSV